ncbi:MAG: SCO family protein [Candidatus Dadabacteria bacterium]|nr:MAG: SCO family protein [Candidatus Dadabacteria bacterium]
MKKKKLCQKKRLLKLAELLLFITLFALPVNALEHPGEKLQKVGIKNKRGEKINLNLNFKTSEDKNVKLKDIILPNRPFIVVPVYYSCPHLCQFTLSAVRKLINNLTLNIGKDYNVITVSFNDKEAPQDALNVKNTYTAQGLPVLKKGWYFLTGKKPQINQLMSELGFNYLPDGKEFAHTAAIYILSPNGLISQYFTGIDYSSRDVRLSLVEASKGSVGNVLDQVLLYCYRFDPLKGKYVWVAFGVMKTGAILTLIFFAVLFFYLFRASKKVG